MEHPLGSSVADRYPSAMTHGGEIEAAPDESLSGVPGRPWTDNTRLSS